MNTELEAAIKRAISPSSIYWTFRDVSNAAGREERDVEIRIDGRPEAVRHFDPPPGWTLDRRDVEFGALFLR